MAKTVIIPIEFKGNSESLQKMEAQLGTILTNSSKKFSQSQITNAKTLLMNIQNLNKQFNQDLAKGDINTKQYQNYLALFKQFNQQAKDLAGTINKDLKKSTIEILSKEDLETLSIAEKKVKELAETLAKVKEKNKEPVKFAEALSGTGLSPSDLKMGKYTNTSSANAHLKSLKAAADITNPNEEQAKKAAFYAENKKNIDAAIKATEKQIAVEKKQADAFKTASKEHEDALLKRDQLMEQLMATATEEQRLVLKGLIEQTDAIEAASDSVTTKDKFQKLAGDLNVFGGFVKGVKDNFATFVAGIATGTFVIQGLKNTFRETIKVVKDLDKAFNEIAMVTTYTTKEVWEMKDSFVAIAQATGMTLSEVTKLAGEFFRQGRSYSEVLKLTEAAGIAARVAGISAGDSVNYLTSAINAYRLSADQAMVVSDKFAALAAASATDYEELAIALSKVAAQAYTAGVSMDNMMGFIAKALETTREAPENIGTAFKTIFARMSELKDFGKTLEDGMDINRIDTALNSIGVSLTGVNGEFRNLDEVLIDVGKKWTSLNKNQKAYITTALAGTRQQTRLLAVFENFDRTMELSEISANSLGASLAQQAKYQDSIAYSMNNVTVAWQDFISSLINSTAITSIIDLFSSLLNTLNDMMDTMGNFGGLLTIVIGSVIALVVQQSFLAVSNYNVAASAVIAAEGTELQAAAAGKAAVMNLGLAGSLKAVGFGFTSLLTTIGPIGWALIAAAAAFTAVSVAMNWTKNRNQEMIQGLKDAQAEIYNVGKKSTDLNSLLEKYQEIDKLLIKTNSDLIKQQDLVKQMQDLVGDGINIVDAQGLLNTAIVQAEVIRLKTEMDTLFTDSLKTTLNNNSIEEAFIIATEAGDVAAQQFLIVGKILEDTGKSYSDYLKMSKEDLAIAQAKANLGLKPLAKILKTTGYDAYNPRTNESLGTFDTEEEAKAKIAGIGQGPKQSIDQLGPKSEDFVVKAIVEFDETASLEAQENLDAFFKELTDTGFFATENISEQISGLSGIFTEITEEARVSLMQSNSVINNILTAMKTLGLAETEEGLNQFKNIMSNSNYTLAQIGTLANALEDLPFSDAAERAKILQDVIAEGPDKAIQNFADSGTASLLEIINLTQELIDTLSTVTFEGLSNSATALNSTFDSLERVNSILSGAEDYDILFMEEMLNSYPLLNDMISSGNELTKTQMEDIAAMKRQDFENDLLRKEAEIQLTIDQNNAKLALYAAMAKDEVGFAEATAQLKKDIEDDSTITLEMVLERYLNNHKNLTIGTYKEEALAYLDLQKAQLDADDKAGRAAIDRQKEAVAAIKSDFSVDSIIPKKDATTSLEGIQAVIDSIMADNANLEKQLTNIALIRARMSKVGSLLGNKNAAKEADEYAGKLNKIYIVTQQLAFLQSEMDKFKFNEENAKTGKDWLISIYSQNKALETRNKLLEDLNTLEQEQQQSIVNNLGTNKKAVTFINGRMVPVMSEYLKLSDEQKEAVDEAADSYNEYSDTIADNTQEMAENTAEMEANLQKIEDKTVEMYDTITDAVRAAEEEKLKIITDGLEEEQKLLDKRRAMYEDAFAEEDYTNSLNEITEERQKLIREIAALEGATDLASLSKRQELIERKKDLDKQYNETTRDFNREALLNTLDDEEQVIEDRKTAYEKEYEERINSVEWLESEIQRIMNGGLEATIQFLKDNLPEYETAWTMSKDNLVDAWTDLYDVVNTTVQEIENDIPDFTNMINQLEQAVGLIGQINGGGNGSGSGSGNTGNTNTGETTTKKTVWVYNGKEYEYQRNAEAVKTNDMMQANNEVTRLNTAVKNAKSYAQAVALGTQLDQAKATFKSVSDRKISTKQYKSGGLSYDTGLAWLDGTKSKPERVLSAVQTELFDDMVSHLEEIKKSSNYSTMPIGQTNQSGVVSIDNVLINVSDLTSDKNFADAGSAFARELRKAMIDRGLNLNRKK